MDLSRRRRSFGAFFDSPCTNFLRSCREKADEAEKLIACLDEAVKTAFPDAEVCEKSLLVFAVKLRKFAFYFGAYRNKFRAFAVCMGFYLFVCVCFLERIAYLVFAYVSDVDDRLLCVLPRDGRRK